MKVAEYDNNIANFVTFPRIKNNSYECLIIMRFQNKAIPN